MSDKTNAIYDFNDATAEFIDAIDTFKKDYNDYCLNEAVKWAWRLRIDLSDDGELVLDAWVTDNDDNEFRLSFTLYEFIAREIRRAKKHKTLTDDDLECALARLDAIASDLRKEFGQ